MRPAAYMRSREQPAVGCGALFSFGYNAATAGRARGADGGLWSIPGVVGLPARRLTGLALISRPDQVAAAIAALPTPGGSTASR